MNRLLRLVLVFLFLLLPPGVFIRGGWSATASTEFRISQPPDVLANWTDDELEPGVLRLLQPDGYFRRSDSMRGGSESSVYVAFYSGYGTTSAHDPAVCLPSQGWDLSDVGHRMVAVPGGESFSAQLFRATDGRHASLVLYWFQPAERWTRSYPEEMFYRVYDAFTGRKQYAFVQLTTPILAPTRLGGEAEREVLDELARDVAPWVRGILEGR